MVPDQEANVDKLVMSFQSSKKIMGCVYLFDEGILMSTHNIHFHDKNISLKYP